MAAYVIDASAAIELAAAGFSDPGSHRLLAPTLLRSQTLSILHERVVAGQVAAVDAKRMLELITALPVRLLGDRVLRGTAWKVADELGWADTYDAEYVALTRLHGDALVTADADLVRRLDGVVPTASPMVLL